MVGAKGRERNEEVSGIGTRETVCGRNRIRGAVGRECRGGGSATQKGHLVRTGKTRMLDGHPRSGQTRIAGKTNDFLQPVCSTIEMFYFSFFVSDKLSLKYESFTNQ